MATTGQFKLLLEFIDFIEWFNFNFNWFPQDADSLN